MTNANTNQPHKELGDAPLAIGTRVYITEYVTGDRNGTITGRIDNDGPDSYNWYVYSVKPDGLNEREYSEFEIKAVR